MCRSGDVANITRADEWGTQCSGDDSSPSNVENTTCAGERYHPPTCHSGLERKRSGGIYSSGNNNQRMVKIATWEDPSTPFHFGRDDMSGGGAVHPHRLYSQRGGRLIAAPTDVIPFIHMSYIRYAPGTAHRPFPTVSLTGGFLNHRIPKRTHPSPITINCPLSTEDHCQLSILTPGG